MSDNETIEKLRRRIDELVAQRQRLRSERAAQLALERNRRELAEAQQLLNQALIALHAASAA